MELVPHEGGFMHGVKTAYTTGFAKSSLSDGWYSDKSQNQRNERQNHDWNDYLEFLTYLVLPFKVPAAIYSESDATWGDVAEGFLPISAP